MSKILILAEKPSFAREIASVIGKPTKRDGFMEVENYIIAWAFGHLAQLAEPEDYDQRLKKWSIDTLPIIPRNFKIKPNEKTVSHFKIVKRLMNRKDVRIVINCCDAGREGELIFRYIYYLAKCSKPVKRMWVSENTKPALQIALKNLQDSSTFDHLAAAAMARSQADWLVGINATRAFTVTQGQILSIGRVQTPTLALLVNREREIRTFIPQTYYELLADFITPNGDVYKGKWVKEGTSKFIDDRQAEKITNDILGKNGVIQSIDEKKLSHNPPSLYNLTDLQIDANIRFGFIASKTMDIVQALYEKRRLLTYPRTESRHLTQAIERTLPERLGALSNNINYQVLINDIDFTNILPGVIDDRKVTDHHAIISTETIPNLLRLPDDERKIYDLVARRFLAIFYPPALDKEKTIVTNVEGNTFYTSEITEEEPGWRVVYREIDQDPNEEANKPKLPKVFLGMEITTGKAQVLKKKSKPPQRYTDASLLSVMEDIGRLVSDKEMKKTLKQAGGLGTAATRDTTIERLISVGYAQRDGRRIIPTPKGENLIDMVPEELKSPELTARWEKYLHVIEKGNCGPGLFMKEIVNMVRRIIEASTDKSLRA
ncbi:DNA topoisomerase 3 [Desulforamulus aquiferis]|uniref:DNA topoisomerase n=1 Tax=Desulforamulus aquiferis TaxID=1397668 RepID=A0AAW7ZAE8_9FIRM|nr:DNA topoisomerase 3 [Desulforamulus aquiferis]MDO7785820.1 DNA topoisomerase 3 [Desulforamulus aquiferis]